MTPKRDTFFLMGDFNSKVGGLNNVYPNAMGKHTMASTMIVVFFLVTSAPETI